MFKLTYKLEDVGLYPTFAEAFTKLQQMWNSETNQLESLLSTIWITTPQGGVMFYNQIMDKATKEGIV